MVPYLALSCVQKWTNTGRNLFCIFIHFQYKCCSYTKPDNKEWNKIFRSAQLTWWGMSMLWWIWVLLLSWFPGVFLLLLLFFCLFVLNVQYTQPSFPDKNVCRNNKRQAKLEKFVIVRIRNAVTGHANQALRRIERLPLIHTHTLSQLLKQYNSFMTCHISKLLLKAS